MGYEWDDIRKNMVVSTKSGIRKWMFYDGKSFADGCSGATPIHGTPHMVKNA